MTATNDGSGGQPPWMLHAWRAFGEREVAGSATNPAIRAMFQQAGHPDITSDEVAWCAAFVGACLERADVSGTRSLLARSYLTWGTELHAPRLGCIAVFSRGNNPAHGHVGFWVGEHGDRILVLGGNQSDQVGVEAIGRSRLLGYRWTTFGHVGQPPATGSASAGIKRQPGGAGAETVAAPAETVFDAALAHVLQVEGGWSDDPHDPGGPTNKGITLADYARYRKVGLDVATRARLIADLKEIDTGEIRAIYLAFYWHPSRAAELPPALALMHFDASVNHGLGAASRFLQRAVGADVDGEVGPLTLAAAKSAPTGLALQRYGELRRERYRSLGHFWRFGRGWLRRVDITLARASDLLATTTPPQSVPRASNGDIAMTELNPVAASQPEPRRSAPDMSPAGAPPDAKWWGQSLTIWGVVITALSTVLPALAPLAGLELSPDVVRQLGQESLTAVQAVGGLIGTLLAVYGRAQTSKPLARREIRLHL